MSSRLLNRRVFQMPVMLAGLPFAEVAAAGPLLFPLTISGPSSTMSSPDQVPVPGSLGGVPEPATWFGGGLASALAWMSLRRRRTK